MRLADTNTSAIGDNSNFFAYDRNGNKDNDIKKYLKVNSSTMAAWQIYLLMTSYTVMPVYWHGDYLSRKFIFKKSDLDSIKALGYLDISGIADDTQLLPSVSVKASRDEITEYVADITCCYWNEWKGLVKEHAHLVIKSGEIIEYTAEDDEVIYEYHCGIFL